MKSKLFPYFFNPFKIKFTSNNYHYCKKMLIVFTKTHIMCVRYEDFLKK